MLTPPSLDDLMLFHAVATTGSFTKASLQLDLPKSTVSRRLSDLEKRVGTRLLVRTTRRVELTEAGERLLVQCEKIAEEVARTSTLLEELDATPSGKLRISLPLDFAMYILAPQLGEFTRLYPGIQLDFDLSQRPVDLIAERFDLTIRMGVLPDSSLVARRLLELPMGLYASPEYVKRYGQPQSPECLAADVSDTRHPAPAPRFPAVALVTSNGLMQDITLQRNTPEGQGERCTARLRPVIQANGMSFIRELTLSGAGIARIPRHFCHEDVRQGRLVEILPEWTPESVIANLVLPGRGLVPRKVQVFIAFLQDILQSCPDKLRGK